jgi:hypothetical protein
MLNKKKEDSENMKLFSKILEGIGYWMLMTLVLFCVGVLCMCLYFYFGSVFLGGINLRDFMWNEGLYIPILWPFALFSVIGWAFNFHIGAFMKVAAILSAIAIICDRAELMKEEDQNEQPN